MLQITLSQFTPGQAERITGVSVDQQRNLRRHGYLATNEGHARFDAFGLARLLIFKVASDRGIGPSHLSDGKKEFDIAHFCSAAIVWHALSWSDAYEGDHATFAMDGPRVDPLSDGLIAKIVAEAAAQSYQNNLTQEDAISDWTGRSKKLRMLAFDAAGRSDVIPGKFFIWWANGEHTWQQSLDYAFANTFSADEKVRGACIIIDLEAMGSALLSYAGQPLAHVEELAE